MEHVYNKAHGGGGSGCGRHATWSLNGTMWLEVPSGDCMFQGGEKTPF